MRSRSESSQIGSDIKRLTGQLIDDLMLLDFDYNKKSPKYHARRQFINYTLSVATHSVGLRASISPFNCSREQMIAYVVDMFKLKEAQYQQILTGRSEPSTSGVEDKAAKIVKLSNVIKRHSWRPELKLRLNPLTFFYDKKTHLNNLSVRVYYFKDPKSHKLPPKEVTVVDNATGLQPFKDPPSGSTQKLQKDASNILGFFKLNPVNLIRPVNELKYLVRFMSFNDETSFKMVYSEGRALDEKRLDDINLRIRKQHCQMDAVHILRLEFWSDVTMNKLGGLGRLRRLARACFNRGSCHGQQRRSMYMNEDQNFYGFINLRLSSIPAYAIKRNYPIMSLREKRVNNCELCIEFRNRRILGELDAEEEEAEVVADKKSPTEAPSARISLRKAGPSAEKPRKSSDSFIINHMRLYVNCLIYQAAHLDQKVYTQIRSAPTSFALDNILYLAAYSLINQHRLQSNLNQLEDQALRRVSLLLLLYRMSHSELMHNWSSNLKSHFELILISIIQNEYLIAHRSMDERTLQDVDPFRDDPTMDSTRDLIVDLESLALKIFASEYLVPRIRRWFIKRGAFRSISEIADDLDVDFERLKTLVSLRSFKSIVAHFKRNESFNIKLGTQVPKLSRLVDTALYSVILEQIDQSIRKILDQELVDTKEKSKRMRRRYDRLVDTNPWQDLLDNLQQINNDINSYWSDKGFKQMNKHQTLNRLKGIKTSDRQELKRVIMNKLDVFLKD